MTIDEYKTKALRTDYKTYDDLHTGEATARLDYASIGLATSAAIILDLIKKSKKGKTLNKEKIKEELGDLLWYLNLFLDESGESFESIMEASIEKIDRKYPKDDPEKSKDIVNI